MQDGGGKKLVEEVVVGGATLRGGRRVKAKSNVCVQPLEESSQLAYHGFHRRPIARGQQNVSNHPTRQYPDQVGRTVHLDNPHNDLSKAGENGNRQGRMLWLSDSRISTISTAALRGEVPWMTRTCVHMIVIKFVSLRVSNRHTTSSPSTSSRSSHVPATCLDI